MNIHNKKRILFLEDRQFYSTFVNLEQLSETFTLSFDGGRFDDVNELKNFDLVIFSIYSSYKFNLLVIKLKNLGIPSLLMFDGVSEFSNFLNNKHLKSKSMINYHPIISDMALVVGHSAKQYFEVSNCLVGQYMPLHMSQGDKRIDMCKDTRVMITTANTAYHTQREFNLLLSSLKEVISFFESMQVEFFFRIFDKSLIEELNIDQDRNCLSGSFQESLSNASHVVTTPSSISLTAMYHNRPVMHLIYRDFPSYFQSGWQYISGVSDKTTFMSFIESDEHFMKFQFKEVSSNYDVDDVDIEIKNLLSKYKYSDSSRISEFENNILYKMLDSRYNINFEYAIRKVYWKLKGTKLNKIVRNLRNKIVNRD
ncbi:hypothetical protein [Vibrio breoganii]|nr:hypothetical protein [Vibrio breoganii]PMK41082.1 hypothetical protein BCU00_01815 [Vibrio breoganii]